MAIKSFTKPVARQLGQQVEGLLQDFCKLHGLTVEFKGGKFSTDLFEMKVSLRTAVPDARAVAARDFQFQRAAILLGLPEDCCGKKAIIRSNLFTITGINLKCTKYPVCVTRSDGKLFKMPADDVRLGLLP